MQLVKHLRYKEERIGELEQDLERLMTVEQQLPVLSASALNDGVLAE